MTGCFGFADRPLPNRQSRNQTVHLRNGQGRSLTVAARLTSRKFCQLRHEFHGLEFSQRLGAGL
jgi:hypothetical protein